MDCFFEGAESDLFRCCRHDIGFLILRDDILFLTFLKFLYMLPNLLCERVSEVALYDIIHGKSECEYTSIHLCYSCRSVPEVQDHQRNHIKLRGFELHDEESNTVG